MGTTGQAPGSDHPPPSKGDGLPPRADLGYVEDGHADGRVEKGGKLNRQVKEVDEEGALQRMRCAVVGRSVAEGLAKVIVQRGHQLVDLHQRPQDCLLGWWRSAG